MGNWKKQFKVGPRYVGKVKSFQKGWGVIITPGYGDLFVHWRALQVEGFKTLDEGDEVEFSVVNDSRGIRADKVIKTRSKAIPAAQKAIMCPKCLRTSLFTVSIGKGNQSIHCPGCNKESTFSF